MYKINYETMTQGMNEMLKEKINNLENLIETGGIVDTKNVLDEYYQTRILARSILVDTQRYDDFLINNRKKLLERGIKIK